jgi:hypothetical protein
MEHVLKTITPPPSSPPIFSPSLPPVQPPPPPSPPTLPPPTPPTPPVSPLQWALLLSGNLASSTLGERSPQVAFTVAKRPRAMWVTMRSSPRACDARDAIQTASAGGRRSGAWRHEARGWERKRQRSARPVRPCDLGIEDMGQVAASFGPRVRAPMYNQHHKRRFGSRASRRACERCSGCGTTAPGSKRGGARSARPRSQTRPTVRIYMAGVEHEGMPRGAQTGNKAAIPTHVCRDKRWKSG